MTLGSSQTLKLNFDCSTQVSDFFLQEHLSEFPGYTLESLRTLCEAVIQALFGNAISGKLFQAPQLSTICLCISPDQDGFHDMFHDMFLH